MYTINERIIKVRELFCDGSNKVFARALGKQPNTTSNWTQQGYSVGRGVVSDIAKAFPNLDDNWLLTGEGSMLKDSDQKPSINYEQKGVPYYDVDFIGGFEEVLNDQTINPEYFIDFKPYNTAKYWANVSGHSMEPNISHGDIIAIKEIENWIDFLPFGEIYGIVTDEFRTIKVVSKGDSPETFNLIPLNKDPQYVQQEIPKRLIRKVFSVLGAVKKF